MWTAGEPRQDFLLRLVMRLSIKMGIRSIMRKVELSASVHLERCSIERDEVKRGFLRVIVRPAFTLDS